MRTEIPRSAVPWRELFHTSPLLAISVFIQMALFRGKHVKVGFPAFDRDGERIGTEWMWCRRIGYDVFVLDNEPQVTDYCGLGDIITAGWSSSGWLLIDLRLSRNPKDEEKEN
jgi:hypothetical protein